ncbi:ABC transporter substrate-binding protein [Paenibacillus mendelii]|uniref:ABC transporter substrate-binding protein n=1 Tax=Paenibacillus mendelii TaxID=206163 RepID=A0ABV6JE40_9BACL|nr:sugar ABC transporter substrate-binding protein [Paenibacillus mendelii]MCQ6563351.1 sugar ABC transporter substrate-binding protein [Paenibacillus mendelii]
MKANKWTSIGMIIVLMFVMIMTACSNNKDSGGNKPADTPKTGNNANTEVDPAQGGSDDKPVTLRLVMWGPPLWTETIPAKFKEKYPNITLEVVTIVGETGSVLEKVTAMNAAGTPADMVWIQSFPEYVKDDLLVDLKPYMESDPVLSAAKFPQSVLDAMTWKGKLVALPRAIDAYMMYVNKDLLAKHGVEMPTKDWSWEEFREIAKKVTDPAAGEYGISPFVFNFQVQSQAYAVSNGLVPNLQFMNEDLSQSMLEDPKVFSAVQWMADLGWVDGSRPTDEQSTQAGIDPVGQGAWITGKFAFDIMGQWEGASRKEAAKFNWDLLPLPKGSVKQIGYNNISPMGILKSSQNIDEAVKFLSWLISEDGQRVLMADGNIPLTSDPKMWEELAQIETWQGKAINDAIVQECCWEPALVGWDKYISWFDGELGSIIKNGGDLSIFQRKAAEFNPHTKQLRKELGLE